MSTEDKPGQVIAISGAVEDFLVSFRLPDLTDEQWAARDAEILRRREDEAEAAKRERVARKRGALVTAGFPERALDAAAVADENAEALRKVSGWDHASQNVLVLSGPAGCGKTVAATWWAMRRDWPPAFVRATSFAASSRYDRDAREKWLKASALVLDDLGTEFADTKGSFLVDLDELIDVFYGDRRPLIITTNCTPTKFRERYGERVIDRIRECGSFWSTDEKSRRGR